MGQITRTTNPTHLRQIDKKHFVIRLRDDGPHGRVFWLDTFDFESAGINGSALLSCIAHAGSTEEYFELGRASDFNRNPLNISTLATDKPLRFRFICNMPGSPLLIGYADGVRALDEVGNLGSSLVDIEPADLHGIAWSLVLPEGTAPGERPNVLVERSLFANANQAVQHPWFGILVMPEVMRQIATAIAENPTSLEDSESWVAPWADFLDALGADLGMDFSDDEKAIQAWTADVVERFASKGIFKHHMTKAMKEMSGEQP